MNILCYINKLYKGGAERVMTNLANDLQSRGHHVTVVTDYCSDDDYVLCEGINRVSIDGYFQKKSLLQKILQNPVRILKLRKIACEHHTDVLISFIKEANQRALLAALFSPMKNIISVRIDPKKAYKNSLQEIVYKCIYQLADGVVFQTREAQSWYPKPIQERSEIILNPVAEQFYTRKRSNIEKKIVTCGRLTEQKNHLLLIKAFQQICKSFPDHKLVIYGTGPMQEKLTSYIVENELEDRVSLAGRSDNVPESIGDAELFVLSSDFEGLPNALMEAMALGIPVISTDCSGGGARTLIDDGVDGYITPCSDVQALSSAMRQMLEKPELANQLAEKAKQKAALFSVMAVGENWEKYIRYVAEK